MCTSHIFSDQLACSAYHCTIQPNRTQMRSKAVVPVELDTEKPEKLVAGEIRSAGRLWRTHAGARDSESDWDFIIDFNADIEREILDKSFNFSAPLSDSL